MIKIFVLLLPFYLFGLVNPYDSLSTNEKLNILVNLFVNQELKQYVPDPPIKGTPKDIRPIKAIEFEAHFSYIQRFKNITEEREEDLKNIEEKYLGDIGFYNGNLKSLKKFFAQDENINPIIQHSINKAFKITYGKPKIKDLIYDEKQKKLGAILFITDIYGFDKFPEQKVHLDIPENMIKIFIDRYRESFVNIVLEYKNNILNIQNIEIIFEDKHYKGYFLTKKVKALKLNIKIDDDVFQLIDVKHIDN